MPPRFSPYQNNGGTVIGITGADFAVVTADTRTSVGHRIISRDVSKVTKLTDKCVIATGGMEAETVTLHRVLKIRVRQYEHDHRRCPSVEAIAQLLSNILYYKRFFPYYTFNVIAGVDDNGQGAVYGYDAIGSHERLGYAAQGTGSEIVMSVLDQKIKGDSYWDDLEAIYRKKVDKDVEMTQSDQKRPSCEEIVNLSKQAMYTAAERDIYTGDTAEVWTVCKDGIKMTPVPLRID
eukprot:Filipodium_phascolosomae@DN2870_c0_g1_i1.p1